MKKEDIDRIIAEAVENDRKGRAYKWHRGKAKQGGIATARKVLNWTFMIGFLIAIIIYFVFPEQKVLFFSFGFGAIVLKLVEFYLRFMF